jgi:hypothetical protein
VLEWSKPRNPEKLVFHLYTAIDFNDGTAHLAGRPGFLHTDRAVVALEAPVEVMVVDRAGEPPVDSAGEMAVAPAAGEVEERAAEMAVG